MLIISGLGALFFCGALHVKRRFLSGLLLTASQQAHHLAMLARFVILVDIELHVQQNIGETAGKIQAALSDILILFQLFVILIIHLN